MSNTLHFDPFADDEVVGVDFDTFVPYLKGIGSVAGGLFGGGSGGGGQQAGGATPQLQQLAQLQMLQLAQQQQQAQAAAQKSAATRNTIFLIGGVVVGLGAIGTMIYFLTKKK